MLSSLPIQLTQLRYQFDNQVTESDILRWLTNFDENEWGMAIRLLSEVQFFSEARCGEVLARGLTAIIEDYKLDKVYILPVGSVGKSGHMIAFSTHKLCEMKALKGKCAVVESIENLKLENNTSVFVLLDDFSGSGNTIAEFYNKILPCLDVNQDICVLTVAYMRRARLRLEREGLKIYGVEQLPAFAQRGSVFGYPLNMKIMRTFAQNYGAKLYHKQGKKISEYTGPLGYANSQSLVCFHHTTPNNSLPILWASKVVEGRAWIPLFPRFEQNRIDMDSTFERRKYYWASLLQKLGLKLSQCTKAGFDKDRIKLIGVIHYKHQNRSDAYICSILGISLYEFESLLNEGRRMKLIAADGNLTPEGNDIYGRIRKADKNDNSYRKFNMLPAGMNLYIPNRFLGLPRNHTISDQPEMETTILGVSVP